MRHTFAGTTGVLALATALFAAQVPRPAPEFSFSLPNGKQIRLSQYKGKVVALEFLLTTCPHCQRTSSTMQKLFEEMGSKGFQPLGAAINDGAETLIPGYVRDYRLTYPVGIANRNSVIDFLEHPVMLQLYMPQLVVIDRKGTIRAQYSGTDDFFKNEDQNIRDLLSKLLKE